jgi:ATP sulfurylase
VADLFDKLGDIGIEPMYFDDVMFDQRRNEYREVRKQQETSDLKVISGTIIRQYLVDGKAPPEWMMRPEASKALLRIAAEGGKVLEA